MNTKRKWIYSFLMIILVLFILIPVCVAVVNMLKDGERSPDIPQQDTPYVAFEFNKGLLWNSCFLQKNAGAFVGWEKHLDTFEAASEYPMYLFKPHQKFKQDEQGLNNLKFALDGDTICFSTNSLGFRGEEIQQKKKANEYRILCLGASTTEGTAIENTATYPYLLEKNLQKKYKQLKITVINAGHGGTQIEDQIEIMKIKGLALEPDLVIYYGGHNNVCSRILVKDMPCYYEGTCWEKYWQQKLNHHSNFFVRKYVALFNYYQLEVIPHEIDTAHYNLLADNFFYHLNKLNRLLSERHTGLLVCSIINICNPQLKHTYYRFHKNTFSNLKRFYPITIDEIEAIYNNFNRKLEDYCIDNHVTFADMAKDYPKEFENFIGDLIHFSKEGNEELVQRMLPYVSAKIDSFSKMKKNNSN